MRIMAQFLRGKQAGVQTDLSAGLSPDMFILDDAARYGVNSQISALAYDPVQSLLAVGTSETKFGSGQIYIYGQRRICVVFTFPRKASARFLQFCGDKLVSVDSRNDICVYSLRTRRMLVSYAAPSYTTALLTDPSLDYAFIGLQSGEVIAYDIDRENLTPFKVPCLWTERNPRALLTPVISLAFSPRDIGKIVVGYPHGAVVFSFKQNITQKFFEYEVPAGAPGEEESRSLDLRRPKLTRVLWHPNGHFILTAHEDGSLVLWDAKDGRRLLARTINATNIDEAGTSLSGPRSLGSSADPKQSITQIAWCVKEDTDDTGLLIAGGCSKSGHGNGLTFLELDKTPNYQTSSWQVLAKYFENVKRQITLTTPAGANVVDFCLIPRSSPYFAGAHDPIAILALLSSGELLTLSFPSGHFISPTNMLHPSLYFVHPFVNKLGVTQVDRAAWLGLKERRTQGPKFLLGGAEVKKHVKLFESRNIIYTAHADGIIRLWDAGDADEIENADAIQVDLGHAVGRDNDVEVTDVSVSWSTGELSVGLRSGELVIFRWGNNTSFGCEQPVGVNDGTGGLTSIVHRSDPSLRQGFLPLTLLDIQQGSVTALKHSQVGFVAAGFEGGSLAILDLRGPAMIYKTQFSDFLKPNKRSSFRKSKVSDDAPPEWATSIEFGVMTLEGESYSSICCFVGTSRGNFATFKIYPAANGTFAVSFAGVTALDDKVVSISPIDVENKSSAIATSNSVGGLRNGLKVNGVVIAVTVGGCRIFKPATAKGARRSWDDCLCDSASLVKTENGGYSIVCLFGDGNARTYSIPALREIGCARIGPLLEMRRLTEAAISSNGDIFAWIGPSEIAILKAWGSGRGLRPSHDRLYNEDAVVPSRPTISNVQWISGTQYVSPADMDLLIGGPDRPPSKRMLEEMKNEEQKRRIAGRGGRAVSSPSSEQGSQESYWSYMQRQVQERTERLGITGDSIDRLEENSSNWANDVSSYVKNQKRKMAFSALSSKFGL